MNRRDFFHRTVGAAATVMLAPLVPAVKPQSLAFHPDAFKFVMAPIELFNRTDILYGWAKLMPDRACRVENSGSFLTYINQEREALAVPITESY